jgi:potassium/chloride transporter 4/5/6
MRLGCVNAYPGYGSNALIRSISIPLPILNFFFSENFGPNYPDFMEYTHNKQANPKLEVFQDVKTTFFLIMAIYFPAVTGILTGTNMSGDLANPQKSIPAGTIAAQLTTSFIYFSLALVFGAAISPELLRDKYLFVFHI